MTDYYAQYRYVSNSDLSALKRAMSLQDVNLHARPGLTAALNFGNLVDAKFTEPDKMHRYQATEADHEKAELMYQAGLSDPTLCIYMTGQKQHEVYREAFPVEHEGHAITIPARGKLDFVIKHMQTGADLKTTACTSKEAFYAAIFHLDYDRAAAWYMDLLRLETFFIIGIGKKREKHQRRHPVFKYAIRRDDETYRQGKAKYSRLAFYYNYLIYNFKV